MKLIVQLVDKNYLPGSSAQSVHGPGRSWSPLDLAEAGFSPSPGRRTESQAHRLSEINKEVVQLTLIFLHSRVEKSKLSQLDGGPPPHPTLPQSVISWLMEMMSMKPAG